MQCRKYLKLELCFYEYSQLSVIGKRVKALLKGGNSSDRLTVYGHITQTSAKMIKMKKDIKMYLCTVAVNNYRCISIKDDSQAILLCDHRDKLIR